MTTLPSGVAALHNKGVLAYLRSLKKDATELVPVFRAKIMFVGNGGVGKTSLLRTLKDPPQDRKLVDAKSTDGVMIEPWELPGVGEEGKHTLTLDCWDFAGQEEYFPTHRFFMCSTALYLLVWNPRIRGGAPPDEQDLTFW
jgi:internalin A